MDSRLTDIDLIMRTMDTDDRDDAERELAFAILAVDVNDHATLNWLAACCAKRAGDLTGYEPGAEPERPDIYDLFSRVRHHPDYVFGTIFTRADFEGDPDDEDAEPRSVEGFLAHYGHFAEDRLAEVGNELIADAPNEPTGGR